MRRIISKIAAWILVACMIAGLPTAAFAEETAVGTAEAGTTEELDLEVSHSQLKCGSPVTFTVTGKGGSGQYKYYLNFITINTRAENVVDPSKLQGYTVNNEFEFTFYASGKYMLRFYVMDAGGKITTKSKTITIEIDDKDYPAVEERVSRIVAECNRECTGEYEKALWLHDWVLDNCRYDYSYLYCGAEGAIARGLGTCEAYHSAYMMLLKATGIEAGRIEGYNHVWTAVKIDGSWCHVDATWDDIEGGSEEARHRYFGLNDELMSAAHPDRKPDSRYTSDSIENSYYVRSGIGEKWAEEYLTEIKQRVAEGESSFEIEPYDKPASPTYNDTIKYSIIAYLLETRDMAVDNKLRTLKVRYEDEKFRFDVICGHDFRRITTAGGYLRHGETYSKCSLCGEETARKSAMNGYSYPVTKSFRVSAGKKSFTARWKKAGTSTRKKFTGYQIQYSAGPDMSSAKYAYAGSSSKYKKIKGLPRHKKYYVRVRSYVKKNGNVYYSKWSSRKAVKTR